MATPNPARKRTTPTKAAEAPQKTETGAAQAGVLHLPHVDLPHVPMPHVPTPRLTLPTGRKGRLLWWGGLAGVAALGVVDWPVAVVVGVGSWVAEQYARQARSPEAESTSDS